MSAHPPDGSDQPEAVDPVMLAVLSNRGRDATLLTPDQERLLDDWVAGRLAPQKPSGPPRSRNRTALPPSAFSSADCWRPPARARRAAGPHGADPRGEPSAKGCVHWRLVAFPRSLALAGVGRRGRPGGGRGGRGRAVVAAGHAGRQLDAGRHGDDQRPRSAVRTLGHPHARPGPAPGPVVEQRFHDVEVPISILKGLLAAAAAPRSAASREIEPYLSMSGDGRSRAGHRRIPP